MGDILREERRKRNLTQEDIAKALNVNRVTYTGWESGKHEPKICDLIHLAEFYKTSIDYIVGRYSK